MSILGPSASTAVFHKRWRETQADPGGLRAVPVALAASVTIEPLVPYLGAFLAERGLHARFTIAPFNQIYQGLLDPESDLRRADAAVTVVLPRLEELCSRSLERLALLDPGQAEEARAEAHAEIGRLVEALSGYERATRGMLLCGTLPPPATTPLGVLDASHPASVHALQRELNVALWRSASRSARLRLVDVDALVAHLGGERAWDPRMALVGGCPYSAAFLRLLGERLARSIAPLFRAPAKVLVLDLDNTLWGGIVGEDGPGGLALGGSCGVGAGYVSFQEALLALRAQGVLLCVASKNNPDDAHEVLDRHPGMRIRRQHLSAERISWEPKSGALRQLSEELGLGLDSFVFVDDSPAECEEIRRLLPEVSVLQLPPDPARFVEALRAVPALDRMVLTGEDRMRADLYAAERERSAARPADAADPEAMARHLRSLQLRARVRRLGAEDLPRAAQLTQKTNQFNLTTIRRTEAELAALRAEDGWRLYGLDVADRFGDYGFTGLALARRTADDTWDLDTVLLSCRVLGRGVETALLAAIVRDLAGAGARRLTGRFVPTAKNAPARDFLARHGFAEGEGGRWTREPLPGPPLGADHVAVTFEG